MANEVKYNNVNWPVGTPIAGERLSTNGYHTGQHKGSVTQDAKGTSDENQAYYVENTIVRFGTILGDAADENFPTIKTNSGDGT